jgi:hypothetical protein
MIAATVLATATRHGRREATVYRAISAGSENTAADGTATATIRIAVRTSTGQRR